MDLIKMLSKYFPYLFYISIIILFNVIIVKTFLFYQIQNQIKKLNQNHYDEMKKQIKNSELNLTNLKKSINEFLEKKQQKIQTTKDIKTLITSREEIRKKLSDISSNPLCKWEFKKEILEILSNNNCSKEDISNVCQKDSIFNNFSKKEQVDILTERYIKNLKQNIANLTNKYDELSRNNVLYKKIISQTNFQKIKEYIFTKNEDKTLLPNDLSEEEKTKIGEIRKYWKSRLDFIEKRKSMINEKNQECENVQKKLDQSQKQIDFSTEQQKEKEREKDKKEKEIKKTEEQLKVTTDKNEKQKLKNRLEELPKENIELAGQIHDIQIKRGILEDDQRMNENRLNEIIKIINHFPHDDHDKSKEEYERQIDSLIKSFYEIT